MENTIAILLAAGSGARLPLEKNKKKQFHILNKHPLYQWSLCAFLKNPNISRVILVCPEADINAIRDQITQSELPIQIQKDKAIDIISGGKTRAHSAFLALKYIKSLGDRFPKNTKYIAIHDAARAYLTQKLLSHLFENIEDNECLIPSLPLTDTVKRINNDNFVLETPPRQELVHVQTPQLCHLNPAIEAFEKIDLLDPTLTDDASILEKAGYKVKCILGDEKLMKITYPGDFERMEIIMSDYPLFEDK